MNRTIDSWGNSVDVSHAMLEGLVLVEISDATAAEIEPAPLLESRRGRGIQSIRASASGFDGFRAAR